MFRRVIACILVLGPTFPAWAGAQTPGASRFDTGWFCALDPVSSQVAEDTISGRVDHYADRPAFAVHGDMIPAALGVSFGVHVQASPGFDGPVTIVVTHPPMGPDGVSRESWQGALSATQYLYNGFAFEEDYELVTGEWTMSAFAGSRLVYKATFQVVPGAALPGGPPNCTWQDLSS